MRKFLLFTATLVVVLSLVMPFQVQATTEVLPQVQIQLIWVDDITGGSASFFIDSYIEDKPDSLRVISAEGIQVIQGLEWTELSYGGVSVCTVSVPQSSIWMGFDGYDADYGVLEGPWESVEFPLQGFRRTF